MIPLFLSAVVPDPLIPDPDTGQSLLAEELARPEYGSEMSPLTRFFANLLRGIADLFNGEGLGEVPVSSIVLLVFAVFLIALVIIVLLNPVRLLRRQSADLFGEEEATVPLAQERARLAGASGQWEEAVVWEFRACALIAHEKNLLVLSPGLTAKEVVDRLLPHFATASDALKQGRLDFDGVRYGTAHADEAMWRRMQGLSAMLQSGGA